MTDPNTLYIPTETLAALELYAADERKRMENPVIQELITPKSLAQQILKNALIKQGYMYQSGKVKGR